MIQVNLSPLQSVWTDIQSKQGLLVDPSSYDMNSRSEMTSSRWWEVSKGSWNLRVLGCSVPLCCSTPASSPSLTRRCTLTFFGLFLNLTIYRKSFVCLEGFLSFYSSNESFSVFWEHLSLAPQHGPPGFKIAGLPRVSMPSTPPRGSVGSTAPSGCFLCGV